MPETSGLYTGPVSPDKHARNVRDIESAFFGSIQFDTLLTELVEKNPDNDKFTIVDIGSGDGAFIKGITDPGQVPSFLRRLNQGKIEVRVVGFTDSPTPDQMYTPVKGFRPSEVEDFEVNNYYYTLTAHQSLSKFLEAKEIGQVNLFVASQSLMYVSSRVFEASVEEIITRLKPCAKALIWGIGAHEGPLPAFAGVDASELRSHGLANDSEILNLFIEKTRVSKDMPLLTLKEDWNQTKARIDSLISRFTQRNLIDTTLDEAEVKKYLDQFIQYQSSLDDFKKLKDLNFDQIDITEAEIAIRYYLQLNPFLFQLKRKQYAKQVQAKQDYIQKLIEDKRVNLKILRRRDPSGVDAFLMEKI